MTMFGCHFQIVIILIIFQEMLDLSYSHRTGTVQVHRKRCYRGCLGYLECLVRGIEQRCDDIGNSANQGSGGNSYLISGGNNFGFVYPNTILSDRRVLDNSHAVIPHPIDVHLQSNTISNNDKQNDELHRRRSEEELYNSRIGQAIAHTLMNKIGRNRQVDLAAGNSRNFTSIGWRDSRIRSTDGERRNQNIHQSTLNNSQTTSSPTNENQSQDNTTTCTACDGNSDCSGGNYCYYSATCARRTCQPL